MDGSTLPYWLRQNKFVDRRLFLELLSRLDGFCSIRNYLYVGMGGAGLEDHRMLHSWFDLKKLVSLEISKAVLSRQKFNRPNGSIICALKSASDFSADIGTALSAWRVSSATPRIIWFDYTSPREIGVQLRDFQALIDASQTKDILRITVNAHAAAYLSKIHEDGSYDPVSAEVLRDKRLKVIAERLDELMPADATAEQVTEAKLPRLLLDALRLAALSATRKEERRFVPLLTTTYADGQRMLSLTGIVLAENEVGGFLDQTGLGGWEFYSRDWKKLCDISLPPLTMREKLLLDQLLPAKTGKSLSGKLRRRRKNLRLADSEIDEHRFLESYRQFYRFFPQLRHVDL